MPPTFMPNIQWTLLKKKSYTKLQKKHIYGTITLYGSKIPNRIQFIKWSPKVSLHTTSPRKSLSGIQFVLYRFRSPLLTISQLLSFPPPTKMFQFGGFPILHGSTHKNMSGSPIRQSWVPKMYAPRPSLSQLTTTFIGNSSQAIPQIAQVAKF